MNIAISPPIPSPPLPFCYGSVNGFHSLWKVIIYSPSSLPQTHHNASPRNVQLSWATIHGAYLTAAHSRLTGIYGPIPLRNNWARGKSVMNRIRVCCELVTRNEKTFALTGERIKEGRRQKLCSGFSFSSLRQQHVVYGVSETESDVSREMMSGATLQVWWDDLLGWKSQRSLLGKMSNDSMISCRNMRKWAISRELRRLRRNLLEVISNSDWSRNPLREETRE